jgi:hypothetical protein
MRSIFLALVFLAACTQAPAPSGSSEGVSELATPEAAAPEATALLPGEPMATGVMGAFSEAVPAELGLLEIRPDALHFYEGEDAVAAATATEFLGLLDEATPVAPGGQTFAAMVSAPGELRVELRRVTGPAPAGLCANGAQPRYVALAHMEPLTVLWLYAFTGADAPSPHASDSALCASYPYAVD